MLSSFIINCVVIIKAFAHVFLMPKTRDILPPAPLKKVFWNPFGWMSEVINFKENPQVIYSLAPFVDF